MGKAVRLSRITKSGRMLCIPADHSFTVGPIRGLENPNELIRKVASAGATCFLAHKGVLKSLESSEGLGLILHLSASTSIGMSPNRKVIVSGVEEAIRIGADAVSVHVNIGCKEEPEMLQNLGELADKCDEFQLPLVAMMYARGEMIKEPVDPEVIAHVARIGSDAGADIVKTVYTGSYETFREVVRRCQAPVVLAGGPKVDSDKQLLDITYDAMRAGAMGVAFGRNVFQHRDPQLIVKMLARVVFEGLKPEESIEVANSS
ncbi:MAG: 2-amino-3,7-dideoxy-D-threo-hept-6-ulosonate synthase [Conexivisphaerales archaeon]